MLGWMGGGWVWEERLGGMGISLEFIIYSPHLPNFASSRLVFFFFQTHSFNIWMMFWFYFDSMWLSNSFYFFMFHGLVIFGNDKFLILTWFLWIVLYLYLYLVIPLLIYLFFFSLNKYLSIYYLMSILLGIVYSFLASSLEFETWKLFKMHYLKDQTYAYGWILFSVEHRN